MELPKGLHRVYNMKIIFITSALISNILFAQGFQIKAYQISATAKISKSDSLKLNGSIGTSFNQTSSSDSLFLSGGFSKSLIQAYDEPPVIVVETEYDSVISYDNPPTYTATSTDINGIKNSSLYIQPGGRKTPYIFPMLPINDSTYAATVPDTLLSVRNFRAWVVSEDSLSNESVSPYEMPAIEFPRGELSMENRFSHYPEGVIAEKWRLISWPGVLIDGTLKESSLDDGYVFYDWDIQNDEWLKPDTIISGKAYWFKHKYSENASFSNHNSPVRAIELDDFIIELEKGWNIIGSPFSFPVETEYDPDFVTGVYLYDGNDDNEGWSGPNMVMAPWAGYAVHAKGENDIITLKPFGTDNDDNFLAKPSLSDGWKLKLKIEGDDYFDYTASIGRKQGASEFDDENDKLTLPKMNEYVSLLMDVNQNLNYQFSSDIRSIEETNGIWNLRISSSDLEGPLELTSLFEGSLPPEFNISLVDIQSRVIYDQFLATGITISESALDGYDLRLIAGDAQFVMESSQKILDEIPSEFLLSQNYPNPFNPVTNMNFELPRSGRVLLTIYNVRGQEVKTLINENLNYGLHTASWQGIDNMGRPVSSGVYFSELRSRGVRKTRKMVFLK